MRLALVYNPPQIHLALYFYFIKCESQNTSGEIRNVAGLQVVYTMQGFCAHYKSTAKSAVSQTPVEKVLFINIYIYFKIYII